MPLATVNLITLQRIDPQVFESKVPCHRNCFFESLVQDFRRDVRKERFKVAACKCWIKKTIFETPEVLFAMENILYL
jgi:hypothetical protein